MTRTTITMTKESKVEAIGQHRQTNCKEVVCLDTGTVYTSVTDAAEAIGVTTPSLSYALNKPNAKCKGKKYIFAKSAVEHLGEISLSMASKDAEISRLQEAEIDSIHAIHRLQDENERLRNENAELQIVVDHTQGQLEWHAQVVANCHEQMSIMEQELTSLREQLAEYKEREAKRDRIKALRAELAELEKEEL